MTPTKAIEQLRSDAAAAGNVDMVATCDLALSGPPDDDHRIHHAFEKCLRVIREAESQRDS